MYKLLLLLLLPLNLFCQNTIGLPDVINYTKQGYNAGLQNWHIKQDKNGIIYVANNEGLLCYDGKNWTLHALPNKTIARSIEIGNDNRIYVGGQDELGYFSPAKNGLLQYHSLNQLIAAKDKSFGDVWDIVVFNNSIFFRCTNKIFKLTNEKIESFTAFSEWSYLGVSHGNLYAHDYQKGLLRFLNKEWMPILPKNILAIDDPVTGILPLQNDSTLIGTQKNGLFILTATQLTRLASPNNDLFKQGRISGATKINTAYTALATINSGIYIIDRKGNIIQSFSRAEGLQNNNVRSIFCDGQANLWLGLDNGIDLVAFNSAIKLINPMYQGSSGHAAIIFNNQLFIGTSNQLYQTPLQAIKDLSFSKGDFTPVGNTRGQVWSLATINNQLLLGKHEGAFAIKNNIAQPVSAIPGFWNFVPLSGNSSTTLLAAGNYKGVMVVDYSHQQWQSPIAIPGFQESSRYLVVDKSENIWVSHPYHGVFKLFKNSSGNYVTELYTDKNGLPNKLNNQVFKINREIVVATERGVFKYNEASDSFEMAPYFAKLLGNQGIRYLKEDLEGNIWFIHDKTLGVIDLSAPEPRVIYLPELTNKLLSGFEFIYPVNNNNIFVGGEKGIFNINYEKYKKTMPLPTVQIRIVKITDKKDSLLFGGYFNAINEKQQQQTANIPILNDGWKMIHFEFGAALYGYQANLEYSYRLIGFDESWSSWTSQTEKEYTKLGSGKYQFQVKLRNNFGYESVAGVYGFTILPPWYQSVWATIIYLLLTVAGLLWFRKWQQQKFRSQQQKNNLEQERLRYIHELEINKTASELMVMRNEKLEGEVNYKNAELASSAMHLVKKSELFSTIKTELTKLIKELNDPETASDLKRMIKTLSEADNMDQEWENFAKHFDKVHSDFLRVLKEQHPDISSNELKLSAYLRMNLSTKEIARLMNISVRGVDISRYRLRKKLLIASEESLFDYMIGIQVKT